MPRKKTSKKTESVPEKIWEALKDIAIGIFNVIKGLLIAIEKLLKIVAIFIIAISTSFLFIILSIYLFTSTFGVKDSPVFQDLRDRMANIYVLKLENKIQELEIQAIKDKWIEEGEIQAIEIEIKEIEETEE